jgi:hypothetical protein
MDKQSKLFAAVTLIIFGILSSADANGLRYECSKWPLEVTFTVVGGYYSGKVQCGNLFLQPDIPTAPAVRYKQAKVTKFYTLMMLDFDGNADGSWPEPVPSGENSPVRHWIIGNIPGALLRGKGYAETDRNSPPKGLSILQLYRAPHIPVVSDRYGIYLFEQSERLDFKPLSGPITNYNYTVFFKKYGLSEPAASNFFVCIYVSGSPFTGRAFHGNEVSSIWHRNYGKGNLTQGP